MLRVLGLTILLALCAAAAHTDEDRSAYTLTQAKLTEQLNAQIAKSGARDVPAAPAKQAPDGDRALAKASGVRS